MTLVKYNPVKRNLSTGFPNLFNDFFNDEVLSNRMLGTVPSVNIKETDDSFFIELAAPGLKKGDFSIEAHNENLTISASVESESNEKDENGKYTKREFNFNSFKRSFTLPESTDSDAIEAIYKDGVLNISIPKKEEAKEKPAKTIKIG